MAKKNNVQNFVPEQEYVQEELVLQEEVLFESEAYGNAQPDAGMGTTVCKPVGIGGPVPIIAPRNSTIQLQPIVVPMAVVPYMSQDSDVLQTEGVQLVEEYDTAASDFSRMETEQQAEKREKSKTAGARAASFFMFLLSGLIVVAYMLAYFKPEILTLNFARHLNVIGQVVAWAEGTAPADMATTILHAICFGISGITAITTLITLFVGKLPTGFVLALSLISALAVDGAIIYNAVVATKGGAEFVAMEWLEYIIVAGLAILLLIISIIVLVALNKKKDLYYDDYDGQNLI